MRTIIIDKGQEVQPGQYRGQLDIEKVIIQKDAVICNLAFYGCTGITELTIAEGVTIGDSAFSRCTGITEVNISVGVTIGDEAFYYCTGITKLNIAEGVKIGYHAYCFNTVERFSMPEPIMYVSRQLMLRIPELFETLRNKGHQEFNMTINRTSLIPYQGVQSLQSLCVNKIVGSDGIKDLSMAKSIMHSQQLLASEKIERIRCYILERNAQCTRENSKAHELYAMIQTHK